MRTVTLRDVARECGVSVATVSAVVNGASWVSDDTRTRVQDAVDGLGYRPNQLARGLKTRSGYGVGVIVSDLTNPYFTEVVRSLSHALHETGRALLLCDSDHRYEVGHLNLKTLYEGHIAGLVLIGDNVAEEVLRGYASRHKNTPIVAIERDYDVEGVSCLLVDSEHGAHRVTRHLIQHGYKRIAMITGPHEGPGSTTYGRAQRYAGYCRALEEEGRPLRPEYVVAGNFRHASGREAMHRLLALNERPDAVFASNDLMALGAMDAAREQGLRVPDDIALVGWDDIPITALTSPALTTVAMPKRELGLAAAELLSQQIPFEGPHEPVRQSFEAKLVIRRSSQRPHLAAI